MLLSGNSISSELLYPNCKHEIWGVKAAGTDDVQLKQLKSTQMGLDKTIRYCKVLAKVFSYVSGSGIDDE